MAEIFNLPAVGDTMVEGEIVDWFVAVGDVVDLDQRICELETDKSVVEMTTPYRGTVLYLAGAPGSVIEVGQPLIIVGEPGEALPDLGGDSPPGSAVNGDSRPAVAGGSAGDSPPGTIPGGPVLSPVVRRLADEHQVDLRSVVGTGPGGRVTRADVESAIASGSPSKADPGAVRAMPKVRKRARELGVELSSCVGSGPDGAITLDDLSQTSDSRPVGGERRERMSTIRRSIAAHLTESVQEIPQFTSMIDVDASAVIATRRALTERSSTPIPIDALLMKLMIPVLIDHPIMTAMLDGEDIVYFDRYDIGLAVDTPDGLMVPVVRDADQRDVGELAAAIVQLAEAARTRSIQPSDLSGATTTLNNVGALGVLAGTPILPVGTSVIVAFGKARPIVELRNGSPVSVPMMTISATFDHRLIDGGDSGRFLAQLKQHLEVPALGLLT